MQNHQKRAIWLERKKLDTLKEAIQEGSNLKPQTGMHSFLSAPRDSEGKALTSPHQILRRIKSFYEDLYRPEDEQEDSILTESDNDRTDGEELLILAEEVEHAIYSLKVKEAAEIKASWEEWWTYDGISGPEYWGRINPEWSLCNKGRRQSPINVEPHKLLYDPFLRQIQIDKIKVSGTLLNTGQSLVFRADKDPKNPAINITGGPLAYRYQFEEFYIHYGTVNQQGSEHKIHGYTFPGEIQLYGFNAELYHNMSEAQHKSQGIVGISLMVQIGESTNDDLLRSDELRIITSSFNKVLFKGATWPIRHLSLRSILPNTEHYMTYEGSTTHPGCWETTVWVILNKPIYMTKQEMYALRKLKQGSEKIPKAPLGNNARPLQPLHHRTVRTNIDFTKEPGPTGKVCSMSMHKEMYYKANSWRDEPFQV